ncbi:hypothetical protein, partial [Microbulbifer celer]|uniref:hypothetical protein n=1 Tax=Microbulbifer celer TaxID=435905 RepID=UPI001F4A4979
NSEVKRSIADGSVVIRHVRVGHRQASIPKGRTGNCTAFFLLRLPMTYFSLREKVMVTRACGPHPSGCPRQSKRRCRLSGFNSKAQSLTRLGLFLV